MDLWRGRVNLIVDNVHNIFHSHKYQSLRQHEPLPGSPTPLSPTFRLRFRSRSKWTYKCVSIVALTVFLVVALGTTSWVHISGRKDIEDGDSLAEFPWQNFPGEQGYFEGLRNFVSADVHPGRDQTSHKQTKPPGKTDQPYPTPFEYSPYSSVPREQCFIDEEDRIPAPSIRAYNGAPQHAPEPMLGSYDALGLNKNICFDRYGRYGAYGFGYDTEQGGTGFGMHGDMRGTELCLNNATQIDWRKVNIAQAQTLCVQKNRYRFSTQLYPYNDNPFHNTDQWPKPSEQTNTEDTVPPSAQPTIPRTAVVLRLWDTYKWTNWTHLYLRSLVTELNLNTGAEYDIHLLIQVKDNSPIFASDAVYNSVLERVVPTEYRSLATLWSENLMRLLYPGPFEPQFNRAGPIYSAGRSMHMALQWFASHHPEYDFFWNWEMDLRYVGHWYELLDRVGKWANDQPRKGLWERSARFYIPEAHGDWETFVNDTEMRALNGSDQLISGPQYFPGWEEEQRSNVLGSDYRTRLSLPALEHPSHGRGQPADYITFLPLFQPARTFWIFRADVSGYSTSIPIPPRRASIVTASRFSSRLLRTMHLETSIGKHSMGGEMFPASVALHHGLKAAFAPHPMYFNHRWNSSVYVESIFNSDPTTGESGGNSESVFSEIPQHNFRGGTYYYDSVFAGRLWRRWLGYETLDGGGEKDELKGSGRMCLRSMLLHPVKWEDGDIG